MVSVVWDFPELDTPLIATDTGSSPASVMAWSHQLTTVASPSSHEAIVACSSSPFTRAVPGAVELLTWAKSKGVTPFYITNRDVDEEPGTRRNLEQLGFPFDREVDTLLMQGKNGWTTSDKSPRRAYVANSYRVLIVLGDDLNDFVAASGKTLAERTALIDNSRNWWGQTWFIIPNPMYGSWERAAVTSGGSPCEQMQKKVDALR